MNKNIEKEFKILVSKDKFELLCNMYKPLTFIKQINQYYDTPDNLIKNKQGAMRIRSKNDKHIFTLKIYENNELLEYECEVNENSIHSLNHPNIISLLDSYDIKGPFVKTASLTTNRAMVITDEAELCFDENFYNGICDYEIEYEFKKDHDGLSRFNQILNEVDLHYETNCKSKIARALSK